MKKILFALFLLMFLCTACVMTAGPRGASIVVAPALPLVVELTTPYYVHGGFYYYYSNDRWYYSQSQGGPWIDLPRERYPKEVRRAATVYRPQPREPRVSPPPEPRISPPQEPIIYPPPESRISPPQEGYPREVPRKGKGHDKGKGWKRGHDDDDD